MNLTITLKPGEKVDIENASNILKNYIETAFKKHMEDAAKEAVEKFRADIAANISKLTVYVEKRGYSIDLHVEI